MSTSTNTVPAYAMMNLTVPMVAKLQWIHSTDVHVVLENLWLKDSTFSISCPYPASLHETLGYVLNAAGRFTFTPFANMGDNQEAANQSNEALKLLTANRDEFVNAILHEGVLDYYEIDFEKLVGKGGTLKLRINLELEGVDTIVTFKHIVELLSQEGVDETLRGDVLNAITGARIIPLGIKDEATTSHVIHKDDNNRLGQLWSTLDWVGKYLNATLSKNKASDLISSLYTLRNQLNTLSDVVDNNITMVEQLPKAGSISPEIRLVEGTLPFELTTSIHEPFPILDERKITTARLLEPGAIIRVYHPMFSGQVRTLVQVIKVYDRIESSATMTFQVQEVELVKAN